MIFDDSRFMSFDKFDELEIVFLTSVDVPFYEDFRPVGVRVLLYPTKNYQKNTFKDL